VSLCMGWTTMSMRRNLLHSFRVSHHYKWYPIHNTSFQTLT
jgi:hypothetical protein